MACHARSSGNIYGGSREPSEGKDHDEMPKSPSITFRSLNFMIVWERLHRRAIASSGFHDKMIMKFAGAITESYTKGHPSLNKVVPVLN
jgi:hypothetical protein